MWKVDCGLTDMRENMNKSIINKFVVILCLVPQVCKITALTADAVVAQQLCVKCKHRP